jgi:hypothetical protein
MRTTKAICLSVLATAAAALAGCVTPPDLSGTGVTCALDKSKPKAHTITYGVKGRTNNEKTVLQVKEKVAVKQQTALVFKLDPKGQNADGFKFVNAEVTVVGKTGDDKEWITGKTAQGANALIAFCAPSVTSDTPYHYEVHVEKLGMLDPRVDVKQ